MALLYPRLLLLLLVVPADGNKTHHGPMRGDSPWLTFALAALPNCAIYRNPVQSVSVHISSYIPIRIYYPVVESTSCPSRVYTPIIRVPPRIFRDQRQAR